MKLLQLVGVNIKRMIKDPGNLALIVLFPVVMILAVVFLFSGSGSKNMDISAAFVNYDKGALSEEMLQEIGVTSSVYSDEDEAIKLLKDNEISNVYIINDDFTSKIKAGEKPEIKSLIREETNVNINIETEMNSYINNKLTEELLVNDGIINDASEISNNYLETKVVSEKSLLSDEVAIVLILLIFYILFASNVVSGEIITLKKDKVLKRGLLTGTSTYTIYGSLLIAIFIMEMILYMAIFIALKVMLNLAVTDIIIVVVNIVLAIILSISFGIFITGFIKEPSMAAIISMIIGIVTFFLGMIGSMEGVMSVPWYIDNVAKFTPQYWIFDSINTSKLFPNIFPVIIIAIILFVAGGWNVAKKED